MYSLVGLQGIQNCINGVARENRLKTTDLADSENRWVNKRKIT